MGSRTSIRRRTPARRRHSGGSAMRRPLPLLLAVAAVILGWAGSPQLERPTLAPGRTLPPALDGPATARWTIRAPAAPIAPAAHHTGVPTGDALASLERTIADREYEVTPNDDGVQAPNRAHG